MNKANCLRRSAMLVVAFLIANQISAAVVSTASAVTVTSYYSYSDFGGGDIFFMISSPVTGCEDGFWLRPSDGGFKTMYSTMLVAYMTKQNVYVWGLDSELWAGSSGHVCRAYALRPL